MDTFTVVAAADDRATVSGLGQGFGHRAGHDDRYTIEDPGHTARIV